jgi:hypothetical protein
VPLARDLHPEFGYVGSAPRLFRKLGLVLAFIVFGLVAGASGVAVFTAGPDPDPMNAMALAPAEALISASSSTPLALAESDAAEAVSGQKTFKAGACREFIAERLGGDCAPGSAEAADAADVPAASPMIEPLAPAAGTKKSRGRNQAQRHDSPSRSSDNHQGGYGRLW